jgi:acetate kinase
VNRAILALNIGSSSLKFALYRAQPLNLIERGAVTGLGAAAEAEFVARSERGQQRVESLPPGIDDEGAVRWLLANLCKRFPDTQLAAIGHRVAHGGMCYDGAVFVNEGVLGELESLVPLAPEHQPPALAAIRVAAALHADVPQIACFDTTFHRRMPWYSRRFALPRAMQHDGIVRFGFHGLSYEYIASVLPVVAGARATGRVIVAHLGHGASLCAMRNLQSMATTMGFTPLDGLMMGTRCGAIDPGVVLHLLKSRRMDVDEVYDLLAHKSGLRGVSGISSDVRELEASNDPHAQEALELFAHHAATGIAAQCAAIGGLDVLVFTAGIGEHAAELRARTCTRLGWLGIALDTHANAGDARRISERGSMVDVYVIRTNEELVIARAATRLLGCGSECAPKDPVDIDHMCTTKTKHAADVSLRGEVP